MVEEYFSHLILNKVFFAFNLNSLILKVRILRDYKCNNKFLSSFRLKLFSHLTPKYFNFIQKL